MVLEASTNGVVTPGMELKNVVESKWFRTTVALLIGLNALVVGAETYPQVTSRFGKWLEATDRIILVLFAVELVLRFIATPPRYRFFLNGWNLFDIVIVSAGFVPATEYLSVLRLLRIIRILRAVTVMPHLQKLVLALLRSLPSLGHIAFLLGLLFFAFGATGTYLFRDVDPNNFGSLHRSMLTLFGVVTLEGWVSVMEGLLKHKPWAWLYFVSFILLGTFISMNLFVGVLVNNLQSAEAEDKEAHDKAVRDRLARIEEKLDALLPPR